MNELIRPMPPNETITKYWYISRDYVFGNSAGIRDTFHPDFCFNSISFSELETIKALNFRKEDFRIFLKDDSLMISCSYKNPNYEQQFAIYKSDLDTYEARVKIEEALLRERKIAELERELEKLKKQRNK